MDKNIILGGGNSYEKIHSIGFTADIRVGIGWLWKNNW